MISSTVTLDGNKAFVKIPRDNVKQPLMYGQHAFVSTSLTPAQNHQALAYADYLVRSKYVRKELDNAKSVATFLGVHPPDYRLLLFVQMLSDNKKVSVRHLRDQRLTVPRQITFDHVMITS